MTKRERLAATLAGRDVDRPAVAFWRHVPEADHDPRRLADAMLAFQARWDLDFIKVMSSGVYCVEDWGCTVAYTGAPSGAKQCTAHAVTMPEHWRRLALLDPGAGALGRELEAVYRIAQGRDEDVPVLHTVFSPLTVAHKLAGERLHDHLREAPDDLRAGLETITATLVRYVATAFEAGADGLFFATQTATPDIAERELFEAWDLPGIRRAGGRAGALVPHPVPRSRKDAVPRRAGRTAGPRAELARPRDHAGAGPGTRAVHRGARGRTQRVVILWTPRRRETIHPGLGIRRPRLDI